MSLDERLRCEQFAVNSDRLSAFIGLPKEFVGFEMEVCMRGGSCDLLSDQRRQPTMMKGTRIELFLPRMPHPLMEWNVDFNWRFNPGPESTVLCVLPTTLHVRDLGVFPTQFSIDGLPLFASNILWTEVWVTNYLEKILEA
jgi:hypothetical protein